jgi:hypothetical protein
MKQNLTSAALAELNASAVPPCLSLYQPTHRRHPDNRQDPIRFRHGIKNLEASLRQQYSTADTQALLEPFHALAADSSFWNHTSDGLAVLGAEGMFRVFVLPSPVAELAVVADSFHTKPLRRILQSSGRYHLLCLNLHSIKLYEGDRDVIAEIDPAPGVPRTITDALGEELSEPHLSVSSYGGVGGGHSPMHHGQGGRKDETDKDAERYFRAVDRAVAEHYSKPTGLPLILAALSQHHDLFRRVSHNPLLVDTAIDAGPDALTPDQLRQRAWQTLEPQHLAQQARLAEAYGTAQAQDLGSDDLTSVVQAAVSGRVGVLFIEADRQIAGRLDLETGGVVAGELINPHVDDVLDDLATLVERMGGQVHVMPAGQIPGTTGLAAIYRN